MPGWSWVLLFWVAFAGTHIGLSSAPVRGRLLARAGERGFQGLYSVVALATFIPLTVAYSPHDGPFLYTLAGVPGVRALSIALSALAFLLVALSFAQPSPTSMGARVTPARGTVRITRHALFAGIALWGTSHLLVNGFLSDVIFFGGFAVYPWIGAVHQDARKQAGGDPALKDLYRETSVVPFAAILTGRNRLVLSELSGWAAAAGLAAAALMYWAHALLFR